MKKSIIYLKIGAYYWVIQLSLYKLVIHHTYFL